jgi:hypothetical protein
VKIAFITAGLKPSADGVGDYTAAIASEVTRQGHECVLLALNDWNVSQPVEEVRDAQGTSLRSLRLPQSLDWPARLVVARKFLDDFGPDWVSWQFVSYAYHARGFSGGLASSVRPLFAGRRLHLFLHELWIGTDEMAGLKDRLVGLTQRRHLLRMIQAVRPDVVQTNNPTYVNLLARHGTRATALPLFGNVPVTSGHAESWLFPLLQQAGLKISAGNRADCWLFGFFGSLHEVWPPEPLLPRIRDAAARLGKKVAFISIGRLGPGATLWSQMGRNYEKDFVFLTLGIKSGDEISQFLNTVDFGVATSPMGLIGKSGTVAAMLEHGLPVIVNRTDQRRGGVDREPLEGYSQFIQIDEQFAARLAARTPRVPQPRISLVAGQFLEALGVQPAPVPAMPQPTTLPALNSR